MSLMDSTKEILGILGTLLAVILGVLALRHRLRPIRVYCNVLVAHHGSIPDQIIADITNISDKDQVMTDCRVRSVYPITWVLKKRRVRKPFQGFSLSSDKVFWDGEAAFLLMKQEEEPIRFAPKERKRFVYALSNDPFEYFLTPQLQVVAELSDGRLFKSGKVWVPRRWAQRTLEKLRSNAS